MLNHSDFKLHNMKLCNFILAIKNYRKDILQHIGSKNLLTNSVDQNGDELGVLQDKYLALCLHEVKLKVILRFLNRQEVNPFYLFGNELQEVFSGLDDLKNMTAENYINGLTRNIISQINKESDLPYYQNKTYLLISTLIAILVLSAVAASMFAIFPNTETGKVLLVTGISIFVTFGSFLGLMMAEDSMSDYKRFLETDCAAIKSYSELSKHRFSNSLEPEDAVKIKRAMSVIQGVSADEIIPKSMLPEDKLTTEVLEGRDYVIRMHYQPKNTENFTSVNQLYFARKRGELKTRFFAHGEDGVTVKAAVYGESPSQQPENREAISERLTKILQA